MTMPGPVVFTRAGALRGVKLSGPMLLPLIPFGLICGVLAQGVGLSALESFLMSAVVFAGSAQLVVLGVWSHPPDLVAVTLATFVVNLRMALMGPVLSPWLDHLRGWRLWGSLFVLVDQSWAMAVGEIRDDRLDAGFLLGSGATFWLMWVVTSVLGYELGAIVRPVPGHPLFFAALAVFVALLAHMWRGRVDLVPWVIAAAVSTLTAQILPGTFWYIVVGALAGSIAGGVRDHRRSLRRSA
jgi:predicted branched-subunit amino acid permease